VACVWGEVTNLTLNTSKEVEITSSAIGITMASIGITKSNNYLWV